LRTLVSLVERARNAGAIGVLDLEAELQRRAQKPVSPDSSPASTAAGHCQVSGWTGPPGKCGAQCACGTTFDGFDSIAEAVAQLERHIADAASGQPEQRPEPAVVDLRHPWWCDPAECEADRMDTPGDHRSRPLVVERVKPWDELVTLWLSSAIFDDVTRASVYVFVRVETNQANGELKDLNTYSLRLDQGLQVGAALVELSQRGRRRELVDEDRWRGGEPSALEQPPAEQPGNSGPGR
jgi:hypothetical protein